jgi:hypothetical protein
MNDSNAYDYADADDPIVRTRKNLNRKRGQAAYNKVYSAEGLEYTVEEKTEADAFAAWHVRVMGVDPFIKGQDKPPVPGSSEDTASDQEVRTEYRKLDLRARATEMLETKKIERDWKPPVIEAMTSVLATPPDHSTVHIESFWPYGGNVILQAAKKWGKSTLVRHAVECMATGKPLFDRFEVTAPVDRVLLIDMELTREQVYDYWKGTPLRADQLDVWRLRGSSSTMGIRTPRIRSEIAKRIADGGYDLVVMDPIGVVMGANELEENDNTDFRLFFNIWTEMLKDAGVTASLIPHHFGHQGERGRGASVISDWADAIWTGVYTKPEDAGKSDARRFIGVEGRYPVGLDLTEITMDPTSRSLTMLESAQSRSEVLEVDKKALAQAARQDTIMQALLAVPAGFSSDRELNAWLRDKTGKGMSATTLLAMRHHMTDTGLLKQGVTGWSISEFAGGVTGVGII